MTQHREVSAPGKVLLCSMMPYLALKASISCRKTCEAFHWRRAHSLVHTQADEANKELLELLCSYLPRKYPDRFSLHGSVFTNHALGQSWDLSDPTLDPLEVSALNVQAGLCSCWSQTLPWHRLTSAQPPCWSVHNSALPLAMPRLQI